MGRIFTKVVTSPGARWLITVGKDKELLGKRIENFHYVVMKLIWNSQRGRTDCDTAISFLGKRMNHLHV